jgi:hypothetical protein
MAPLTREAVAMTSVSASRHALCLDPAHLLHVSPLDALEENFLVASLRGAH